VYGCGETRSGSIGLRPMDVLVRQMPADGAPELQHRQISCVLASLYRSDNKLRHVTSGIRLGEFPDVR